MKKAIFIIALFAISEWGYSQTNIPVSSLQRATTPLDTADFVPLVQGGHYKRAAMWQIQNGWSLTGNAGINPATNLMGTTDNVNLNIARWGVSQIQLNRYTSLGPGHRHVWSFNVVDSLNQSMIRTYSNSSANIYSVQLGANDGQINGLSALFDVAGNQITLNDSILQQNGLFQLDDGTQGDGKLLTSDANGNASWQQNINSGANAFSIHSLNDSVQIYSGTDRGNFHQTFQASDFYFKPTDGSVIPFYINARANEIPSVTIDGGTLQLLLSTGYADGQVLTSDASGNASWQGVLSDGTNSILDFTTTPGDLVMGYTANNNARLTLSNSASDLQFYSNDPFFDLNGSTRLFQFGDYTDDWYGTKVIINDDAAVQKITLEANNGVQITNLSGHGAGVAGVDNNGLISFQAPIVTGATGSEPGTPYLGQFYFDTTLVKMKFWNGSAWAIITSTP